ncbi:hypothetical protein [Arsenophonus nasoniae]|uniref:hypothetical protein n=2 Tax=Arsenophonus nasoniae TaxID=638 RepID=UPI003879CBE7
MINKLADLCYSHNYLSYQKENKLLQQEDIKIKDQLLTLDNSINMNDEIKNNNLAKKRSIRDVTLAKNKADVTVNMLIDLMDTSIKNIKQFYDIKKSIHYIELKDKINEINFDIKKDKVLYSSLSKISNEYEFLKKDIINQEKDIEIYRSILLLSEQCNHIYHIYHIYITGFSLESKTLEEVVDKINSFKEKVYNIKNPPLHFKKEEIYQELIDSLLNQNLSNENVGKTLEVVNLINHITKLFYEKNKLNYNGTNDLINIYVIYNIIKSINDTDKHAFGDLSINDIIDTELIYSYIDENDKIKYDTTTIFDCLTRYIKESQSPLSIRNKVNIKYPKEYNIALINYLDEEAKQLKKDFDLIKNIDLLKEKKDALRDEIPDLEKYLTIFLLNLSEKNNITNVDLKDKVIFRYNSDSFNPEVNAASKNFYPPIEMKYTIRDILLGKERKWLSENIQYKRDDNYKNGIFPFQYTEKIKSEINNTDIQNIYISKIENLKNNNEMKEKFYIFLKELLATYNKKEQSYYLLETSPLLLFFADKNRGPRTGNDIINDKINPIDTPIDVVSILTGERLKFASFRDMKMKIDNNIMLKVWFKNHFSNYSDPNISTMKLIKKERDYSYLYENILTFNIEEADILVRSPNEALLFELFERFKDIEVYFSPPTLLIGSITGVAYQSILAASPSFFQAAISDTSDEYYLYLKEGIINIVAELLGESLSEVASKTLAKSIKLYLKNKFIKKSLHINDAIKNFSKNDQLQQSSKILKLEPNELENRFEIKMLSRINPDNLTNDIPSVEYLAQLKADDTINKKITSPIGQCESLMEPVANFMANHDMTNIKYRGIYIWDDATDEMPLNHFVVLGKKNDKNYVFDLTAHQFANEGMPSLNAPLILEETEWGKRYIAAGSNKLIKYKDFNTANRASDVYNAYPGHAPNEIIDGEKILITPPWYWKTVKKDINQNDLIELSNIDSNATPTIRDQIYQIATTDLPIKDNFTFTAEILQHSGLINEAQKTKLIDRLKNISQQAGSSRYEQLNELIEQAHQITTIDQLLQLKKGELVVFSDNDSELVYKNKSRVHTMVSLGNGRFATMASNALDPSLDDGMQFLMAEQLIPLITGKTLKLLNPLTIPKYFVYAGYPKDSSEQDSSLLTTVYKYLADGKKIKNTPSFISLILQKSGELSPEQALIFSDTIEILRDSDNSKTTINDVITNKEKISDVNQLTALSSGTLVIFHKTDYQVSYIMMSIGKKGFITLFSEHLEKTSKYDNELISPS